VISNYEDGRSPCEIENQNLFTGQAKRFGAQLNRSFQQGPGLWIGVRDIYHSSKNYTFRWEWSISASTTHSVLL